MYRVHEFAQLAGVTVKALHHYDRIGLLKPRRNTAGYRSYLESDLAHIEKIVALRFLGIPLKQIRDLLHGDPLHICEALHLQRTLLEKKRSSLDSAIGAILKAEKAIESGEPVNAALREIIKVIEMQNQTGNSIDFMKNYYREEGWKLFKARHSNWPSREWNVLFWGIMDALGEPPLSSQSQTLAARWRKLRLADSGGDPGLHFGLLKAWNDRLYWPEPVQKQFAEFELDEISRFVSKAFASYREQRFGDIVWVTELDSFSEQEKQRLTLSTADLHLKIEKALGQDPGGETGQALAARWMELVESRTGSRPPGDWSYESALRWMDSWPPSIFEKLRSLDFNKIFAFMLSALSIPS